MQSQRGLKNHFSHMHYLTTNDPLDVIVLLCYSFNCMRVSIQLLAAIQINRLIDWLIDWKLYSSTVQITDAIVLYCGYTTIPCLSHHGAVPLRIGNWNAMFVEPRTAVGKSKLKRTSLVNLNSIKCWSYSDQDVPQFATLLTFQLAKAFVLQASMYYYD